MKKSIGAIGLLLGVLVFSLELYGLKLVQSLEMVHGVWARNVWHYATEAPCTVALVLTAAEIVCSVVVLLTGKNE